MHLETPTPIPVTPARPPVLAPSLPYPSPPTASPSSTTPPTGTLTAALWSTSSQPNSPSLSFPRTSTVHQTSPTELTLPLQGRLRSTISSSSRTILPWTSHLNLWARSLYGSTSSWRREDVERRDRPSVVLPSRMHCSGLVRSERMTMLILSDRL